MRARRDIGWRAGDQYTATRSATFRPKVEHVIGGLHQLEVVLDDHDRVAFVDQALQHAREHVDLASMQPGTRFIEHVERARGTATGELSAEP
jgi:hypothetical protein